jgi:hypothetical protein
LFDLPQLRRAIFDIVAIWQQFTGVALARGFEPDQSLASETMLDATVRSDR